MQASTAKLKNYRQAPRKVRLIADTVRGKRADRALGLLSLLPKRGAESMAKLIRSAVANANMPASDLYISKIEVGGGVVFKRLMPRARGRGSQIRKKASHITLSLSKKSDPKSQKHEQGS
ncbi:50S ribosomal protein L22 [Candidatus Adlerbacteria bacterium RIFCSPHIGHO2_01_FULL_54_23]|uniref:Large ribosomal subunit protein uL22 n=3 Tax=Candidatus Adleribacteriota TaxID=1752736 RepID=A0A1F4Y0D1_9BACT|nr:MAG: 50S ribosomal protein L22 [Candidatus Adlerbacteria bacterium GW2011_GWA1_54_10]KKW36191.1 MAG: 50S ribosomal protein L22 [Candidatus Adlerbacteria bacterium GW2011_GWA2_54_12]KKW37325.1 MAG: 50S ribosomal protein L22 [Candidatus Adlerbacteria bacterium GW2011_GWB1_54_7]OGC78990.1 MAG: 50S ribosomal protein L22 [Candidatus Adlerbacteria bacterium RIFCSPHIGHO2_01_FULL_54_23]OGC87430.1 MAG: 50S ribosomal protein L22 [Candidatus Adlerbacteria bacterium RIFCSPLOWO2_01_FULL_54_16]